MAENRGGFRPTAPQNNPANVSATGGAGQSGQPSRYISGLPYGEGQATMNQQQGAPMAQAPSPVSTSATDSMFGALTSLTAPTQRPNEPITAGMDFGAGPGSEALALPQDRSLSQILASMIDVDPTGEVQDLYNFVASRGL